jgi:hypothetical protein
MNLTEKFIKGLKDYNLSMDQMDNWSYCGGNCGRHKNYFKLTCPNDDIPELVCKCVCGHNIVENCYITDGESIMILGNCCIKKFIKNSGRTCEECKNPHKNRKDNRCNDCRETNPRCLDCKKKIDGFYTKCYSCQFK